MRTGVRRFLDPLVAAAACVSCTPPTPQVAVEIGPRLASYEGFVDVGDSLQLYYRMMGSGVDRVLVVSGGPGEDQHSIAADIEPMVPGRTLVFYDQRGTGRSSVTADSARLTASLFVSDLEALRRHLSLGHLTMIGQGWGAALVSLYAVAHPEMVSRLVLIDPMPVRRTPYFAQLEAHLAARRGQKPSEVEEAFAPEPGLTDSALVAECRAYVAMALKAYYADSGAVGRSRSHWCTAPPAALRNEATVHRAVLASLGDWDWREAFSQVTIPVLVLYGARDPSPVEAAREWAQALPNARLLIIPASGAFPFVEQPGQFFPFVNLFLSGSWPPWAK